MFILKPEWWDYVIWEYDENHKPIMVGFKGGMPKRLLKQYEEYCDLMCVEDIELCVYCIYDDKKGCIVDLRDKVPEDFPERLLRHLGAIGDKRSIRNVKRILEERK